MTNIRNIENNLKNYKVAINETTFDAAEDYQFKSDKNFIEYQDRHSFTGTDNPLKSIGRALFNSTNTNSYTASELLSIYAMAWASNGLAANGFINQNQLNFQQPFDHDFDTVTNIQSTLVSSKLATLFVGATTINSLSYGSVVNFKTRSNCEVIYPEVSLNLKQIESPFLNNSNSFQDPSPFIPVSFASVIQSYRFRLHLNYYRIAPSTLSATAKNATFYVNDNVNGIVNFLQLSVPTGISSNTAQFFITTITNDAQSNRYQVTPVLDTSFQLSQIVLNPSAANARSRVYNGVNTSGASITSSFFYQAPNGFMNYRLAYTTSSGIPTNLYTDIASTTVDNTSLYSIKYLPNSNQAQLVRNFTSNNPSVITQREGMTARAYFEGSMLFQPKYDGTLGNYIVGGLLKAYGVYNAFTDQTDYFYFPSSSTGYNIIEIGAVTDYYNLRGVLQPRFYVVTNNNKNPSALDISEVFVNSGGTFVSSIYTANASNLTIDITASALSDTYFYGTRINGGFGLNWGDGYVVESSTGKTLEIPFREQTTGLFYQLRYSFATGTATVFGINNETSFAAVANRGIRRISNHNYISPDSTESKVSNAASGFIDITTHNYYIDNVQQVTIPIALNDSSIYWSIDGRRVFYDYQTNDYILTVKTDQLEDLSNINSTS